MAAIPVAYAPRACGRRVLKQARPWLVATWRSGGACFALRDQNTRLFRLTPIKLTKQRRARRALYSTATDRSASSAGFRASLSFHVFISAAKARSAFSVLGGAAARGRRRAAALSVARELAPAAVAPAASPPPAAAVAPTRPAAARWAPPSPRRCRAVVATSRYCATVPPPHTTATAARHAAAAATPPLPSLCLVVVVPVVRARARGGAPWKEVL